LDNGLTVLIRPNHTAPIVAIVTLVKAGYYDEPDALTGISHLLEHMFFKGTATRSQGEMARRTKALGGYLNAGTIYDRTSYYTVLPADKWREGLELQADAFANSALDPGEFDREKQVVIQEIKRKYDRPDAMAWERMVAQLFRAHRTRRWRMGTPEQLEGFTREQLSWFYHNYYRPNNAVLAVVGDVDAERVLLAVHDAYGSLESNSVYRDAAPQEPVKSGMMWGCDSADIGKAQVVIGFKGERFDDRRHAALTVLSVLLGQGRSARLYSRLKEEHGLVLGITADAYANSQVGIFTISAEVEPTHLVDAEGAIFGELEKLSREFVADDELEKARNMIESAYFAGLSTMDGEAQMLAEYEAFASYDFGERWIETLHAVTKHELRKVAGDYLTPQRASVFEYWPSGTADGADQATRAAQIKQSQARGIAGFSPSQARADSIARPHVRWQPTRSSQHTASLDLPSGGRLIVRENLTLPTVSIGVYFSGGRVHETPETAGLTRLMVEVAMKETATRAAQTLANEFERLGAVLGAAVYPDYFGYYTTFLSRTWDDGMKLVADIVSSPTFAESELEKERQVLLAEIETRRDSMSAFPMDLFCRALYGDHGYGLAEPGIPDVLQGLHRADLIRWRKRFITRRNMIVVAVGNIDTVDLAKHLEENLASLPQHTSQPYPPPAPAAQAAEETLVRKRAQTALVLGFPTVPYNHPDYFALKVLQGVASGMGGRLFTRLRDEKALAYTVFAGVSGHAEGGDFYVYIATNPENEAEARGALLAELDRFRNELVPQVELEEAKSYLIGNFKIGLQTNAVVAGALARLAAMGLSPGALDEYPERLTHVESHDVQRVAEKYFAPERMAYGVVRGEAT
jgi:zinc protease